MLIYPNKRRKIFNYLIKCFALQNFDSNLWIEKGFDLQLCDICFMMICEMNFVNEKKLDLLVSAVDAAWKDPTKENYKVKNQFLCWNYKFTTTVKCKENGIPLGQKQ